MRKIFFAAGISALFASCFKDTCKSVQTLYFPVFKTVTQVRADMKSLAPQPLQNTGKLYIFGNYIFLNEVDKGIHVIDNTDAAHPKNISFIAVPGNQDLAVLGNHLYADAYSDLVVFDITNPASVNAVQFVNNAFPERAWYYYYTSTATTNPDSVLVTVDYVARDTVVNCVANNPVYFEMFDAGGQLGIASLSSPASKNNNGYGAAGSMSRFAVLNNYLYTVSTSYLNAYDISNGAAPQWKSASAPGWVIETIYPFEDKLFLGSQNGMYIYDVSDAANPVQMGMFAHVRTCDPVIADKSNAFVTLRSGTACAGFTNELDVLNIADLMNPTLQKVYSMTNPFGLSKDGNTLFVCDGAEGLKIYDAANVNDLKLINQITGIETYDVIAYNHKAIVVAKDGLYQYDYSNLNNIQLLSKLAIEHNN